MYRSASHMYSTSCTVKPVMGYSASCMVQYKWLSISGIPTVQAVTTAQVKYKWHSTSCTIQYKRYKSYGTEAQDIRTVQLYSATRTNIQYKLYVTVKVV